MNKKSQIFSVILIIFLVLMVILFAIYNIAYAFTSGYETITIKEKWVKYHGNDAKYLVSSTNGQVFQITDTWVKWRWNSSNLYADLQPNQVCRIETQGWRFPFLSDYKNIITADCKEDIK